MSSALYRVTAYDPSQQDDWDGFVHASKNATFLFRRGYMEYHGNRFRDASLVVRDGRDRLVALLPASVSDDVVTSHGGLTYGGLLTGTDMTTPRLLEVFDALVEHLRATGAALLRYKTVPHIYHLVPAEEDRYALFRAGAVLDRSDVLSVIDYRERPPYQERRRRAVRKAGTAGLTVGTSSDLAGFWSVLGGALARHDTTPVHTLDEISLLTRRFPDRMILHTAHDGDRLLAGVLAYVTDTVCHLQYIASNDEGRALGALDLVVDHAIGSYSSSHRWFDFGISTEDAGRHLNTGLVEQKEGFGARAVVHDHFALPL